ncbi:MAG: alpha/beta fold hydrolase [Gammaproteobacteria bacterium]|nr:alpha/beta fold hydrolase [Gammaproteobacteria bacterium]
MTLAEQAGLHRNDSPAIGPDAPRWDVHPGTGPYLLLVHGFLSSRAQWGPNVEALSAFCQPVTLELYGHGRSPSPADAALYNTRSYATTIDAIRERLGVERWFVCGYSLGATVTIRYALTHPHRLYGHVFTNSASAFAEHSGAADRQATAAANAKRIRDGGREALDRIAVHPRRAKRLPPATYDALVADAERIDPEGIAMAMEHMMPTASVRSDLGANTRPALLVCGRFEKRFAANRDFAATQMPHLEIVDVDAGHAVNMTATEAFNTAVERFVHANLAKA